MVRMIAIALAVSGLGSAAGRDLPDGLPQLPFHLTARPWKPANLSPSRYLDAIEGVCRFTARHLDANGAVIDPFLGREHQYSTPYFAFAAGTLIRAGRGKGLIESGVRAMDHATDCFAQGGDGIPDRHDMASSSSHRCPGLWSCTGGWCQRKSGNFGAGGWRGRGAYPRESWGLFGYPEEEVIASGL